MPQAITVKAIMKDKEENLLEGDMKIISPIHVADYTFRTNKKAFGAMWGTSTACSRWWAKMRTDDPKFAAMGDIMALPNWQRFTVPLIVHGDGAVFTTKHEQKLLTFSTKSLIATSDIKPRIVPMMSLVDSARCKPKHGWSHDTLDAAWPYVIQNLNDGIHGEISHTQPDASAWRKGNYYALRAGKKVCEGAFIFVVWIITGH